MPIGIRQMKISLAPGTILRWGGRSETPCDDRIIEGIHILDPENRAAPLGRGIARCEGQVDKRVPSLERAE
jgi:hypothetical protein